MSTSMLIHSLPLPLTDALVHLAPVLSLAVRALRLVGWNGDWYSSWLALAAWWFSCLLAPALFRYAFPILAALVLSWLARSQPAPLVTESVLQSAIVDLTALRSALPTLPVPSLPLIALLRAAAILTIPWLVFTSIVPTRILVAAIGTLLMTHRAPWARILRSVLWRSAFVRTGLHAAQAFLTGQSSPTYIPSSKPAPTTPASGPPLRFLFSVYENQRWWMGLDWTAALIPSERPSWCSPTLHPVSPPTAFSLPDPSSVYLPSPDGKSRIKRTAHWKWEEPEWRLLVHKEGASLSRIERAPPAIDDASSLTPSSSATSSGSRFFKAAANKLKDSSPSITSPPPSSPTSPPPADPHDSSDQDSSDEPLTDPDGWIYGDNKWESQSHRGGLGKYTRYRRWTRVAIVSEVVQVVSPDAPCAQNPSIPVQTTNERPSSSGPSFSDSKTQSPELSSRPFDGTAAITANSTTILTPSPSTSAIAAPSDMESPLRQRLRAALSKSSSISS